MIHSQVESVARSRLKLAEDEIVRTLTCVRSGNPLAAEPDPRRLRQRLQKKAMLSREEADAMVLGIRAFAAASPEVRAGLLDSRGPEAIYGRTIDFVGIAFLRRGEAAGRAVARVAYRDGRPLGSGFMASDRLFLTNHHVIPSEVIAQQVCIEFEYELDPADRPREPTRFLFDPGVFFLTDSVDGLDYTLVAVGECSSGCKPLSEFGCCQLSDTSDKHALGEVANIIQHPDGRYKEVVLRENRLVSRLDSVLHYVADTEPGSSGSPVFNNEWQVIALHHWGGPWRQKVDAQGNLLDREINEGIRISAIVSDLQAKGSRLASEKKPLLEAVLRNHEILDAAGPQSHAPERASSFRLNRDGTATWQIPVEISVRLPGFAPPAQPSVQTPAPPAVTEVSAVPVSATEEKITPSADYRDRSGYKPAFIEGFDVPLPRLSPTQRTQAARNRKAEPGDDPFELKYHHFSIVVNRIRRLAFFTACNINGETSKHVDRKTGAVTPLLPDDPDLESLQESTESAEASDSWYGDKRLDPREYAGKEVYQSQAVPGHPDPHDHGRTLRMFQRGHLVRRMDPAWGSDRQALLADADTFHWTNCTPQVGFFNMGSADRSTPRSARGRLWRAVENYVLRNAVAEQSRVSSFTGPVFEANDRCFRGIRVPGRFWKIVVWAESGKLRAIAMLADQRPVIEVWPESLGEGPEAYADSGELDKVGDFLSTIAEIERLTGLDFGKQLRESDLRTGERLVRIDRFEDIPLQNASHEYARRTRAKRNGR